MLDFDMGEYAAFVWPAFGITALVFLALAVRTFSESRRWAAELRRLEAARDR